MKKNKAFSIVEMVIVVATIGILSSIAIYSVHKIKKSATVVKLKNDVKRINAVIISSYMDKGSDCEELLRPAIIGNYVKDSPDRIRKILQVLKQTPTVDEMYKSMNPSSLTIDQNLDINLYKSHDPATDQTLVAFWVERYGIFKIGTPKDSIMEGNHSVFISKFTNNPSLMGGYKEREMCKGKRYTLNLSSSNVLSSNINPAMPFANIIPTSNKTDIIYHNVSLNHIRKPIIDKQKNIPLPYISELYDDSLFKTLHPNQYRTRPLIDYPFYLELINPTNDTFLQYKFGLNNSWKEVSTKAFNKKIRIGSPTTLIARLKYTDGTNILFGPISSFHFSENNSNIQLPTCGEIKFTTLPSYDGDTTTRPLKKRIDNSYNEINLIIEKGSQYIHKANDEASILQYKICNAYKPIKLDISDPSPAGTTPATPPATPPATTISYPIEIGTPSYVDASGIAMETESPPHVINILPATTTGGSPPPPPPPVTTGLPLPNTYVSTYPPPSSTYIPSGSSTTSTYVQNPTKLFQDDFNPEEDCTGWIDYTGSIVIKTEDFPYGIDIFTKAIPTVPDITSSSPVHHLIPRLLDTPKIEDIRIKAPTFRSLVTDSFAGKSGFWSEDNKFKRGMPNRFRNIVGKDVENKDKKFFTFITDPNIIYDATKTNMNIFTQLVLIVQTSFGKYHGYESLEVEGALVERDAVLFDSFGPSAKNHSFYFEAKAIAHSNFVSANNYINHAYNSPSTDPITGITLPKRLNHMHKFDNRRFIQSNALFKKLEDSNSIELKRLNKNEYRVIFGEIGAEYP